MFKSIFTVFLVSMLPIIELRGAIPIGLANELPYLQVILVAIMGNSLIVLPLILFLNKFLHMMVKWPFLGPIAKWWFDRVERKSDIVQKYGFWGLLLFVAIPLPGSGVWSGSLAATLLEMDTKKATVACVLGVLVAALIVSLASAGVLNLVNH